MTLLPHESQSGDSILRQLEDFKSKDWNWKKGRSFSLVYNAGAPHQALLQEAFSLYMSENALSTRAFPSLAEIESQIVSMVLGILSHPKRESGKSPTCGTFTSGGTESALLALKAYRDFNEEKKGEIPEVLLPRSVHPCYLMASHYLGLKPILLDCGADFKTDMEQLKKNLGPRTILMVASAPGFAQGITDPIDAMGKLAQENGIGLHVDACLGGIAFPFLRKLGFNVSDFGFEVSGVTSMALDLHKYAFAAKGSSILLYRSMELRRKQFFVTDDWKGGLFGCAGLLGTRSGGHAAAAWAALRAMGESGYLEVFKTIMDTTRNLQDGIRSIPGLYILGKPEMSVFAFGSREPGLSIHQIADNMEKRYWHLDRLQNPDSIHMIITPPHESVWQDFLKDLKECTQSARDNPRPVENEKIGLYGMTSDFTSQGSASDRIISSLEKRYDRKD